MHEATRWVRENAGQGGDVRVEWGFVHVDVLEDGSVQTERRVVQRGTARRR